jgi:hypothetical protein
MAGRSAIGPFGQLSMIFGILAIPLVFCCYLGAPLGIAAIILGIIGVQKAGAMAAAQGQAVTGKGMAIAGIVCGAAALVLMLAVIILGVGLNLSHYH